MEIEVKILEINKDEVIRKLKAMGAEQTFDGEVESFFIDFPDRSIVSAGNVLRLRRLGVKYQLTFKGKHQKSFAKVREELEVEVSDISVMKKILLSIGLVEYRSLLKHRTSFKLGKIHFDIDTITGIPTFMEIESNSEEIIMEAIVALGFSAKDAKPWSYNELIDYYSTKK